MPATRHPASRNFVSGLGLLATASGLSMALSMALPGEAQAQCSVTPVQPLNGITTDNSQVDCAGTTNGATIVGNANSVLVSIRLGGTQFNGGSIELNGTGNQVGVGTSASTTDLVVQMQGNAAGLQFSDSLNTNLSATLIGADVDLRIGGGSIVTATPGNISLASAPGSGGSFGLSGQLYAIGNNGSNYLVTGGSGSQTFELFGGSTLGVQANGLAINGGSGDDVFLIDDGAFITGGTGTNILFNGGNDTDAMTISGSGVSDFSTINIETLTIDAGTGGTRALNGTHADVIDVQLVSGSTRVFDVAALGVNTSQVTIAAGADLTLVASTQQTFNQSFAGAGQIILSSPFNVYTFGGTANGFTGELVIGQLNNVRLTSDTAFGTGTITNNGQVIFGGGLNVSNAISGSGEVWMTGPGQSTISGNNSYSGGTLISAGTLNVTHGNALGSGVVDIDTGASLALNFSADGTLANDLTGNGTLLKYGGTTVTLTGTNTYAGGTNVLAGALRVDDLARLGTGATTVDAGASLILDYNGAGQLLVTTPVMTGGGRFIKDGTGSVVLNTGSLYTGGTIIRAGRLGLNDGTALGTGPVQVDAGATLGIGNIILTNGLSGTGSVVKTASGQAVLSGNNSTFGGHLDIQNGAVVVTDGRSAGSGSVAIGAGTQLVVDSTVGDTTIVATLSGAGDLENFSATRLTLTGSNTLTGTVFVSNGTLQVEGDQNIGTANVVLAGSGSVLDLSTTGNNTLGNAVSGNGRVVKTGAGTVFVTGANTYAGGTDIQQGALRVTDTSVLGSGVITVQQGAALDLAITGQQVLNQAISGAGLLRKSDTGDLTLLGNSLTGGLDVTGGRVIVNSANAIGGGPVALAADTRLVFDNAATETVSTAISGGGGFVKDGAGLLVVQNANTFTGGTVVSAGRLGLNNGQGLGTGGVVVLQGAELGFGNVTLANTISGAGSVIKTAGGTGVLAGANTYSGGTAIQAGNLFVSNVTALGTGGVSIASGTTLTLGNATAQTLANTLTGAGGVVKSGTGDLTMTANALTGGLSIAQGRVLASGTSGTGTGAISISSGAELAYTAASNGTFANGLTGTGTFRKLGAGQLLFSNPFAIGALAVDAGSVRLNAAMTGSATVASGARLDGTGSVSGNLTNNGTVAPGNSIGTLSVQGNYVHNTGSVLEIEFDGNGNVDLLAVAGTATLNGGTLRFISTTGAEGSGGTFLTATGGITGTFATVETVGAQLPLAVIYQPTAGLMAPSVLTARPSTFNAQSLAVADTTLGFIDGLGLADQRHGRGNRVWMSGFGAWADRTASGTTLGYSHDTYGLGGGVNFAAGESLVVGLAAGWASGDITLASNGGGGEQSSVLGALHATWSSRGGVTLGGGLVYGHVSQDTVRNVSFSGFSASVEGSTGSDIYGGFAEFVLPLAESGSWSISASGRGSYVHQSQDGYEESGVSPLRLAVGELGTSTMEGKALLTARASLFDGGFAAEDSPEDLDVSFDIGLRYLAALGDRAIPVTFASSNAGIVLQGDTRDGVTAIGGVGVAYTTRDNLGLRLDYAAEVGQRDSHQVRATVSLGF